MANGQRYRLQIPAHTWTCILKSLHYELLLDQIDNKKKPQENQKFSVFDFFDLRYRTVYMI